jgi:MFS transporter, ACS family, tartrate transporter
MIGTIEQTTMRKVYLRVLPIAVVSYFFCYLDRINVGFAALTMNKDLGLDAATFGFAAGVFFWGYFLFEVPSNIRQPPVSNSSMSSLILKRASAAPRARPFPPHA